MVAKLSSPEIEERLKKLPSWQVSEGTLRREFRFANFTEAFAFMTACAIEAEKMNHHPDWSNVWATVRVELCTHDTGGITELDFELATRMEHLAARFS